MAGKDYPDWGGFPISNQSYPLKDLAEHAVRLGSPVNYDRGGSVAFMDTFEFGLNKWVETHAWGGLAPYLTSLYAENGAWSCVMNSGVVEDGLCYIEHIHPMLPKSRYGLQIRFAGDVFPKQLGISLERVLTTNYVYSYIVLDSATGKIELNVAGVGHVPIATLPSLYPDNAMFHYLKLTTDFDSNRYVRMVLDGTLYDLSAYQVPEFGAISTSEYINISVTTQSIGATQTPIYLDSVIFTNNDS